VAAAVDPATAPLTAVGSVVVDRTPGWLKDAAIAAFGTFDKAALFVVMAAVLAVVMAITGVVWARRPAWAASLIVALTLVAAVAAAGRSSAPAVAVLASLACGVTTFGVLRWLSSQVGPDPASRRRFLQAAVGGAAVAALGGWTARTLGATSAASQARGGVRLPAPTRPPTPVPAGADLRLPGLTPYVTPNADFYRIDTALSLPGLEPGQWQLRVHGLVEREVVIDYPTLLASDLVEAYVTLTCVSNGIGAGLAGNARWLGMPIRDLLAQAGPLPEADMVLSRSSDGWTASTPLSVLTDDRDALLAVGMNGQPLPLEHGFPVRMVVPGLYGYVSATKWVVDLEVTRFDRAVAYWTSRGWAERAPVKTASRIDVPADRASVAAGPVVVAGVAWAQHRGITGVQLQIDELPWQSATLAETVGPDSWRQWSFDWVAEPGEHRLRVRAVDETGEPQTGDVSPPAPDGATGWHTIEVTCLPSP
jgi:DMSO/TMAO reductase YedYZ molybdopterin-dependent catalytic subunit